MDTKIITSCSNRNEVYVKYSYAYYLIHKPIDAVKEKDIDQLVSLARKALKDDSFEPEGIQLTYQKYILIDVSLVDKRLELQTTVKLGG